MSVKRHLLEAATLIIAAAICALTANALASRERKVAVIGNYPNALTVPARSDGAEPMVTPPGGYGAPASAGAAPVTTTETAVPAEIPLPAKAGAPVARAGAPLPAKAAAPSPAAGPVDILARFPPHPDKPAVELSGSDVAQLYASGALFLDARRTAAYESGHIAGARNFSVWEADIDQKVNALWEERNDPSEQNKPIVVYCTGGDCEDSHMLAQKLWGLQFNNVYVYKDGFPDWQKRGGAVRSGSTP